MTERAWACPTCERTLLCDDPWHAPTRPDSGMRAEDVEWLVWFARKSKGTVAEVAQRAIEQNPALRDTGPRTIHIGDLTCQRCRAAIDTYEPHHD